MYNIGNKKSEVEVNVTKEVPANTNGSENVSVNATANKTVLGNNTSDGVRLLAEKK
jgi:hypothetical protein